MRDIAFVACCKTKARVPMPAGALYTSALFRKSLLAALSHAEQTWILSAKHGLLALEDRISPYEKTLKTMTARQKVQWADQTAKQLQKILKPNDVVTMYCGEEYIGPLRSHLAALGCRIREPLRGQALGCRLQSLRTFNREEAMETAAVEFMALMRKLWKEQDGGRPIAECTGRNAWPERGVYFVLENHAGKGAMPRITRVGTHAVSAGSRTTLWNRLSTHRGTSFGGGSHRSSIFRLHVGRSLMNANTARTWPATWGVGQDAPAAVRNSEADLESAVSAAIGAMRVIWLDIGDEAGPASDRAFVERNAIGLLSRGNVLTPNRMEKWLGLHSPNWRIAASGLWNLNHLFVRPDAAFARVLRHYVDNTLAGVSSKKSIAPLVSTTGDLRRASQLDLFLGGGS